MEIRARRALSGHASKGYVGHQFSDALEGPFLHRLFSLADLGGQKDRGAYSGDSASIRSTPRLRSGLAQSRQIAQQVPHPHLGSCLTGLQK
jgi:hypothetical protein